MNFYGVGFFALFLFVYTMMVAIFFTRYGISISRRRHERTPRITLDKKQWLAYLKRLAALLNDLRR